MRRVPTGLFVALLMLMGGCAQQPVQEGLVSEQFLSIEQQSAKIHTELAAEYYSRGQFVVALEEVTEALRSDSKYAPAYNVLGLIYMDLREDRLAQKNFEQALKIAPNDPEAHNNYGWFLCQRRPERMDQAVRHFMEALKNPLYSTPEKPYNNAGICVSSRGDYKSAEEFFQKTLSLRPADSQALIGIAEVNFRSGNLAAAKSNLSRHMQISVPTAESLWLGIQIERKTGDRHAEASYTMQLQKRFPDSKEAAALRDGRFE